MKLVPRCLAAVLLLTGFCTVATAQTTQDVRLDGLLFLPADITIDVGDTVHWEWVSGNHNVESGVIDAGAGVPDDNFRSGDPTAMVGTTYEVVFDQAFLGANPMAGDVYPYYCIVHASVNMAGTITVVPPDVPAASTWGLVLMSLALLIGATIVLARRRGALISP